MQTKNIAFGAFPVKDLKAGLNFTINNKFHDPAMHGEIRRILHTEMLPNGLKRVNWKDGEKAAQSYEYSPREQKQVLKYLDLFA